MAGAQRLPSDNTSATVAKLGLRTIGNFLLHIFKIRVIGAWMKLKLGAAS